MPLSLAAPYLHDNVSQEAQSGSYKWNTECKAPLMLIAVDSASKWFPFKDNALSIIININNALNLVGWNFVIISIWKSHSKQLPPLSFPVHPFEDIQQILLSRSADDTICLAFPGKGMVHHFVLIASFRTTAILSRIYFEVLQQYFWTLQTHRQPSNYILCTQSSRYCCSSSQSISYL